MSFETTLKLLGRNEPPGLVSAFTTLTLSTLAYVAPQNYRPELIAALGADSVTVAGGTTSVTPHVLIVRGPGGTIVAVEGIRNYQEWTAVLANATLSAWPTGPGRVYSPFLLLFGLLRDVWLDLLADPGPLYLCGHSLGAVMASLFARQLWDLGKPPKTVHTFGGPPCVDPWFRDNYHARTWSLDHPLDPVPLAPLLSLMFLERPRDWAAMPLALVPTGVPWVLPAWAGSGTGIFAIDDASALCAAAVVPFRRSPHQTYRYLLAMRSAMSPTESALTLPLAAILLENNLFDPWPA